MTKLSDTQRVILSKAAQHDTLLATPPAKLPAAARQAVLRSLIGKGLLEELPAPREAIGLSWRQDDDGAWITLRITAAGLAAIGVEAENSVATVAEDEPEDARPRDERRGVDSGLVIGDLAEGSREQHEPVAQETAISPTAAQEDSLAAFPLALPSTSGEAPEGSQRPPVSQRGGIGRTAALRMAAASVLAAWASPERGGIDEAIAALRVAVETRSRAPRHPATPRQPRTGTKQEAVLTLLCRAEGATIAQVIEATGWHQPPLLSH